MIITYPSGSTKLYRTSGKDSLKARYRTIATLLKQKKPFSVCYKEEAEPDYKDNEITYAKDNI